MFTTTCLFNLKILEVQNAMAAVPLQGNATSRQSASRRLEGYFSEFWFGDKKRLVSFQCSSNAFETRFVFTNLTCCIFVNTRSSEICENLSVLNASTNKHMVLRLVGGQIMPAMRRACFASELTAKPTLQEPVFLAPWQQHVTPGDM